MMKDLYDDIVLGKDQPPDPPRAKLPPQQPGTEFVDSIDDGVAVLIKPTGKGGFALREVHPMDLPPGTKEGDSIADGLYAGDNRRKNEDAMVNSLYAMPRMR